MSDWLIWMAGAGVLVVLEMFTGSFYLLMIGLGFAAGGAAALAGAQVSTQLLIAGAVGAVATYGLRRIKAARTGGTDAARNPDINLDIGQTVEVESWRQAGSAHVARVTYRGANWDVELQAGASAKPGTFVIREVRGSRLIVANA